MPKRSAGHAKRQKKEGNTYGKTPVRNHAIRKIQRTGDQIGYEPFPANGPYDIQNRHVPGTVTVSGKKVWDDNNDQDGIRPDSIVVILLANGGKIASKTADAADNWEFVFANLREKDDEGNLILYTVDEEPVAGYDKKISGTTITNIHIPGTTHISGKKIWVDGDNVSGLRPDSVTIILYADGAEKDRRVAAAITGWKYTFANLPDMEDEGKKIHYTIQEEPVPEYYTARIRGLNVINSLPRIQYTVEWYYQGYDGYPALPDKTETRTGYFRETVSVTEGDKTAERDRYSLDEKAGNIFSGKLEEDGKLVLKLYFSTYYIITFDPNGGTLDGSTAPVRSNHHYGDPITILKAPVREGYRFLYWEGSKYNPGDSYTVTEDHTFTAQWEEVPEPTEEPTPEPGPTGEPTPAPEPTDSPEPTSRPTPTPEPSPYDYRFSFTKEWSGGQEVSIDWVLYDANGSVVHKKFNKKAISATVWYYEAWFASEPEDYYIIENVPAGYRVQYVNTGRYADVTDRCCNGGTIVNYKIPKTGDNSISPLVWIGCILLGLIGTAGVMVARKRSRGR